MEESVLFKTGSNDTVFRVTADDILPACVLRTGNSDKEVIRSLDATDFSSLKRKFGEDYDIFVSDMFENPSNYYFRCRYIMLLLSIRRQGRYWQRSVRNREISGHWEMLICFTECSEPRAIRIFRYGDVRRVIVWFNCSLPMSCICIKKSAI